MKSRIARRTQIARVAACVLILNFSVPGGAIAVYGAPLRENVAKGLADRAKAAKALAVRRAKSASRLLTDQEERTFQGRAGENPYLAGQNKWDVVYKGVDMMTGNFSTGANDLSFDGGYGIPVNVTRSYSANNGDEGPFGKGWTLSADVRSTAGGLLKSGSAPVRSVPTLLKERPSGENDPNVAVEPAAAVTAIDAGGTEETVQKDVDGILTTPAWDKNVYDSTYEWVEFPAGSGQKVQVLASNSVKTPEGTVYTYAKQGSYPNGTRPWDDSSVAAEAANVLKVTSATDRQGNVTTYAYGSAWIDFAKSNGIVREHPLVGVAMPNGHTITFVWGNGSAGHPTNRIWKVLDNDAVRTVVYDYDASGLLWKVTTPGGKTTEYGYGTGVAAGILTSIKDPRSLQTQVQYTYVTDAPTFRPGVYASGPRVSQVTGPDGGYTTFSWTGTALNNNYNYYHAIYGAADYDSTGAQIISRGVHTEFHALPEPRLVVSSGLLYAGAYQMKVYSLTTADLIEEDHVVISTGEDATRNRKLIPAFMLPPYLGAGSYNSYVASVVAKGYNFMGAPLWNETREYAPWNASATLTRKARVEYAYWGAEKYYQQKAVKDAGGRFSYTDYYTKDDVAGKRGQTSRVYDSKYAVYTIDPNLPAPPLAPGQTQADYDAKIWKYRLRPNDLNAYAAEFFYDAQGRPTDVKKLQKVTTSPWSYVVTHTEYGGAWGQASQVVEDYGTGKINRTTQTLDYTSWGKPCEVIDAAGHQFRTNFDLDGLVLNVTRVDNGANQPLVTYTYGTSGVEIGQPKTVTDGLSGVVQSISYVPAGTYGVGQPASITETSGSDVYAMAYTYGPAGDRATTTQTDNGAVTAKWGYTDYVNLGDITNPSRAFQTLVRLNPDGTRSSEEFHYYYDQDGRLAAAAFAQTPQAGAPTAKGYYDGKLAQSRARTTYAYDGAGRLTDVSTYWDVLNGSSYGTPTLIAQNACAYEVSPNGTGLNRGLKTSSSFSMQGETARTETYAYDLKNDQLTEAHYGDAAQGFPYADEGWGYDAAGNRGGNVCDNLNRCTMVGGLFPATNDILGNRTSRTINGNTYYFTWDALNRMTENGRAGAWLANYTYRADGMRVKKFLSGNGVTTRYRYDGQMTIEDVETPTSGAATITRYGLGPRGVDFIERASPSGTMQGFPLYDAHGNMVATLARSGSSYSVGDLRRYSAWGSVRSANTQGDPKGKFCANLGHRQDDETGFTYMRARYYDPDSARFLSEDPARQGTNWFSYAKNDPVNQIDRSGKSAWSSVVDILLLVTTGATTAALCNEFKPVFWSFMTSMIGESLIMCLAVVGKDDSGAGYAAGGYTMALVTVSAIYGLAEAPAPKAVGLPAVVGFYLGYAAMLGATLKLLDLEVDLATGG